MYFVVVVGSEVRTTLSIKSESSIFHRGPAIGHWVLLVTLFSTVFYCQISLYNHTRNSALLLRTYMFGPMWIIHDNLFTANSVTLKALAKFLLPCKVTFRNHRDQGMNGVRGSLFCLPHSIFVPFDPLAFQPYHNPCHWQQPSTCSLYLWDSFFFF